MKIQFTREFIRKDKEKMWKTVFEFLSSGSIQIGDMFNLFLKM